MSAVGTHRSRLPDVRSLQATTRALMRDTLVSAPLVVVVVLGLCGAVAVWSGDGDSAGLAGNTTAIFVGLYQLLASVSVTALLVPHVAAGGRRSDFSVALLVKHALVTTFFVVVLTVVAACDGSADGAGLLVWSVSWAAGLAVLAATGTLVGAALRRWGRAGWLLLPLTASPLWWFWRRGGIAFDHPGTPLLLTTGVVVLAGIAAHLVLRGTPVRSHP